MTENKQHYGLMTAISMVVGISVGSGIFFKVDDILAYTGGNVLLSALIFIIGALCIIFGSITISQLAAISTKSGGAIGYYEEFISPKLASGFGWFQFFAYYPTIVVVVSWVGGIYTSALLGIEQQLSTQVLIGMFYFVFLYGLNYFSAKIGAYIQNLATILKLIPLLGLGIVALFWKEPQPELAQNALQPFNDIGWGWLAALVPAAFSYDGWIVTTSITHEVKDAKRNMPIALTVGPIIVLFVYLSYFFGMVSLVGPNYIIQRGDQTIYDIANMVFGEHAGTIVLLFILIAILGVVNGITLGHIRIAQQLAEKGMFPRSNELAQVNPKTNLSPKATLLALGTAMIWLVIHYFTQKTNILGGGDVSEVAIVFSYLIYILLYIAVWKLFTEERITNVWFGRIFPILAILGSLIIVAGGVISNPTYIPVFFILCSLLTWLGSFTYGKLH